ncbi:MAG: hypothetical protein EOP38_06240 [Rubrivivax sp.]|nr:MAG: hypothetical protein EOP38_06240 [Rubrivivax sp.]
MTIFITGVGAASVGYLLVRGFANLTEKPIELAITLVGTAATTFGVLLSLRQSNEAIRLTKRQEEKALRAELQRAAMVAGGKLPQLVNAIALTGKALTTLAAAKDSREIGSTPHSVEALGDAAQLLGNPVFDECDDSVIALVSLPDDSALRLHVACAAVRGMRLPIKTVLEAQDIKDELFRTSFDCVDTQSKPRPTPASLDMLESLISDLEFAEKELRATAEILRQAAIAALKPRPKS